MNDDRARLTALGPVQRLVLVAFVEDLAVAMVGLAVQFRGNELGASPLVLGLLGTVSSLAYTIGCLFTGRLSDRFGRRLLTAGSCLICAGAWLVMSRADSPLQLLAIFPLSGAAVSMFWPPLQAWLSEVTVGGRQRLVENIGAFNVSWTIGLMLGPPLAGFTWAFGSATPFAIATLAVLGVLVVLQTVPTRVDGGGEDVPEDDIVRPDGEVAQRFLYLAWIANFASWFGRGMNMVVFPKLGSDLGMSESVIGVVVASLLAGQLVMFGFLRTSVAWRYRLWPLTLSLAAGAAGYILAWVSHSPAAFAASFALSGLGAGVTYVASLYYSLEGGGDSRGGRTGIHEAVLGSGLFIGPLMGGVVGETLGLRASYPAVTVVFVATMAFMHAVSRRMRRVEQIAAARHRAEVMGE
ncbi:MAG: MFS transporter [Armatimonadota bacterium]